VNVFGWLDKFPPTADGEYGDKWEGLTVSIVKPDGSTEVLGPYSSDPVGTIFALYTPTMLGTYTFKFDFPGQVLAGANPPPGGWGGIAIFGGPNYIGDNFLPSSSETVSVTVQSQQVAPQQITPLPTGFWTRPITGSITGWQSIAGNWLSLPGPSNQYTKGPETAHITWTKPITFGGVANGLNNDAYYTGLSYEGYFTPPIIISGVLYYNAPNPPMYGFKAVDLRTGEELWTKNGTGPAQLAGGFLNQNYPMLSFGQVLDYNSPNQHGYIPYLWSTYTTPTANPFVSVTNWAMYDAFTGNYICTIQGIPSGGALFGASNQWIAPDGSILMYNVDLTAGTVSVWNSTACIQNSFPANSPMANNGYWMWRPPLDGVVNGSLGITATVPLSQKNLPPFASNVGIDASNQVMVYSSPNVNWNSRKHSNKQRHIDDVPSCRNGSNYRRNRRRNHCHQTKIDSENREQNLHLLFCLNKTTKSSKQAGANGAEWALEQATVTRVLGASPYLSPLPSKTARVPAHP
jgi:hypothetical protein